MVAPTRFSFQMFDNMEFTITFTKDELQTILNGLGELPAKISLNVIGKIQEEVFKQETKKSN